jgi:perosamine synthetase
MSIAVATPRQIKPFHLDVDADDRAFLHSALDRILDTSTLILGPYTEAFERQFAEYVGTRFAVSVNTATSALEIQLRLEDVAGRLVAVPTNTNFATAAAALHAGARVVFMDMDAATFMPTLHHVREAKRRYPELAGLVWVHIGGVIAPDMPQIASFCEEQGMFLIEDCAHAHGSVLRGQHAGRFGKSGAFSFFPTKVMTTMEGGMVVTDDKAYAALVKSFRNQGKRAGNYNTLHVDLGGSWRLSEFGAAFGLSQLGKLDRMVARRAHVAAIYAEAFRHLNISFVDTAHMDRCSNYKVIATLPDSIAPERAKKFFQEHGVVLGGGVYEVPLHAQPVFAGLADGGTFPVADRLCARQFCLPISSGMSEDDARFVVEVLGDLVRA